MRRRLGHPRVRPDGPPTAPHDAATLILKRRGADGPEVLMGKRSRRAAFVPDVYVFPGGRHDPVDRKMRPATPLDAPVDKMAVRGNRARAQGLAMTAVRETFEETGLLLARPGPVATPGAAGPTGTWTDFDGMGVAPHLGALHYIGRAITSPYSKIRFHARFFLADAGDFAGTLGGSGELSDLRWVGVETALAELPIVDVTEFMLEEILRREVGRAGAGTPLFAYRLDRPFVRYD